MHLDAAQVQALLHGELEQSHERAARGHVAECDACHAVVAQAEREEGEILALLRAADHSTPAISARAIKRMAVARTARPMPRAAGVVLALGIAGVAYAVPGSPVPRLANAVAALLRPPPVVVELPHNSPSLPPRTAGVAVIPGNRLEIVFNSTHGDGIARVRLTDSVAVVVEAPAGSATFSSERERLVIDVLRAGYRFDLAIPRVAPRVEILVGDVRRMIIVRGTVSSRLEAPTDSVYTIPLRRHP